MSGNNAFSITFYHSFGQGYFKRMLAVFSYLWVTAEKMRIEEKRELCYNFKEIIGKDMKTRKEVIL
mgnify:CR=1 FL=1